MSIISIIRGSLSTEGRKEHCMHARYLITTLRTFGTCSWKEARPLPASASASWNLLHIFPSSPCLPLPLLSTMQRNTVHSSCKR